MRTTYKALLLILLLLAPGTLWAQEDASDSDRQQLMRFAANNDAFDAVVTAQAKDLFIRQIPACAAPERAVRQLPSAYGALAFPVGAANAFPPPTRGIWAEHVKVKGCNQIWQINMLVVAQANADPLLLALLPGDTNADPASQRSAERLGATAIRKADNTSCADDPKPVYTKLLGYRQMDGAITKVDAGQGWFEEWDYRFCQKNLPVQLAFTPDGSGGYEIKARLNGTTTAPTAPALKPAQATPAATAPAQPSALPSETLQ